MAPAASYIMRRAPGAGGDRERRGKGCDPAGDALAAYGILCRGPARGALPPKPARRLSRRFGPHP